ncbi:MAG: hypothetical protein WDM71_02920 [Ferruginibacter sp.]
MKNLFILLTGIILFSSCTRSKIVGKWYGKNMIRIEHIPAIIKGAIEYKNDNTFIEMDTLSTVYDDDYIRFGNLNNIDSNMIIIQVSGIWELKDDFINLTCKETNLSIDFSNLNETEKIIEVSNSKLILENQTVNTKSLPIHEQNNFLMVLFQDK